MNIVQREIGEFETRLNAHIWALVRILANSLCLHMGIHPAFTFVAYQSFFPRSNPREVPAGSRESDFTKVSRILASTCCDGSTVLIFFLPSRTILFFHVHRHARKHHPQIRLRMVNVVGSGRREPQEQTKLNGDQHQREPDARERHREPRCVVQPIPSCQVKPCSFAPACSLPLDTPKGVAGYTAF